MSLTDNDLKNIKDLFKATIDEDETLVRRFDINHLPTKDEFYEENLKVIKKLDNLEEAVDIIGARQSEHSDQLEDLGKIHPLGKHSVTA